MRVPKLDRNVRNALQVIAGAGGFALLVFATPTIGAPDMVTGIILTAFVYGLTLLALIGIAGVKSFQQALKHLTIATLVALTIGLLGGHFWAGEPWEILLSAGFFTSTAHIAYLVGVFTGSITDAKTR